MRSDVPLVSFLFGTVVFAAAVLPVHQRRDGSLGSEIKKIEEEITDLEQDLEQDLEDLEAYILTNPHHPAGSAVSTPAAATSFAVAASSLANAVSLATQSPSLPASDSSALASLSSVAASISSAYHSFSAATTPSSSLIPLTSSSTSAAASTPASGSPVSANTTSASIMAPTATAVSNGTLNSDFTSDSACSSLCSSLTFSSDLEVTPYICESYPANTNITITGGQADVACGSTILLSGGGVCRVTFSITTSFASSTYGEVWLPNENTTAWNGRTISTDNGGLDGCVAYDDMQYLTGLGFAAFGDNGGHNSSAYDGTAFSNNNEAVLDWVYRARHESVQAGKDIVNQFYGKAQDYAYYIGCSTGGQQGLHSAQYFPDDFDGIIAGSAAADMNHLEDWSARFIQLTGVEGDDTFLTEDEWIFVQSYIFAQCDEGLDGVDDGIIEDPTICLFNTSAIPVCGSTTNDSCLTSTQINTVYQVFTALYNTEGELLYPALLYGSQVDAYRLGQLSGSIQGIAHDWFAYAVYNNSDFDITQLDQDNYAYADTLDEYHGNVSSFNGDLSAFKNAGKKLLMYHGLADPLVSGANSQRYYQKVAKTLGITDYTEIDPFMRLFRVSGMAHCGVGGISGAGAWMFGQTGDAWYPGVADNIVQNLVDWVENDNAPDTITGTKFWYDEPSLGLEFTRPHCRFPFRTTYKGSGEWQDAANWNCTYIEDWQECGVGAHPRTCNVDGSFT